MSFQRFLERMSSDRTLLTIALTDFAVFTSAQQQLTWATVPEQSREP